MSRFFFGFLLVIFASCAGKPVFHITPRPDALHETLEHSRMVTAEEDYLNREDDCYKRFPRDQFAYEDCIVGRAPASKREFRYERLDPLIQYPDIKPKQYKNFEVK